MTDDDSNDDEDWYDDEDELDSEQIVACPECGREMSGYCDKCNHCGYWLTPEDRRRLRPGDVRPVWQRLTAIILIAVLLFFLLLGAFTFF